MLSILLILSIFSFSDEEGKWTKAYNGENSYYFGTNTWVDGNNAYSIGNDNYIYGNNNQVHGDRNFNLAASYGYYGGSHAVAVGFSGANDKS